MPIPSQKLSQLAGEPVSINLLQGETLEQAEARVLKEHPQDFSGSGNSDMVPPVDKLKTSPAFIQGEMKNVLSTPTTSNERKRGLESVEKLDEQLYGPKIEKEGNTTINDILQKLNALKLFSDKLADVDQMKAGDKTSSIFGKATNTGPFISRLADFSKNFNKEGKEEPPGPLDSIVQSIMSEKNPEYASERTSFQAALKDLEKLAFEFGGKQLTGTEKGTVTAQFPGQFLDDPAFEALTQKNFESLIPTSLQSYGQSLRDMGFRETEIAKLIDEATAKSKQRGEAIKTRRSSSGGLPPNEQAELEALENKYRGR